MEAKINPEFYSGKSIPMIKYNRNGTEQFEKKK